jgi:hypothetical protein
MCNQKLVFRGTTLFCINEQEHSDKGHLFQMYTLDCDRINTLEAENAELRAALRKHVDNCDFCEEGVVEYQPSGIDGFLPTGDANFVKEPCWYCSELRAVLAKKA